VAKGFFIAVSAVLAVFAISASTAAAADHTITVTKTGTGSGTVESSPAGINCGETCSGSFDSSELVSLSAVPDPGSVVVGLAGCSAQVHFSCVVSGPDDAHVTVEFGPGPPAPPPGRVGISINHGARYTNDRRVQLSVVWPQGASFAVLSASDDFTASRSFELSPTIAWRLSGGKGRAHKAVYLKFDDAGPTFSDDIVLDQIRPKIRSVTARLRRKSHTAVVRIRATDRISGVAKMQVSTRKSPRVTKVKFRKRFLFDPIPGKKIWVRVLDRAGNPSRWRSVKTG
jgi:hypothetical protein